MITQIRKSMQTRAFRFTLIVLVVFLAGGAAFFEFVMRQFGGGSAWVLKINGEQISPSHYAHVFHQQDNLIRMLKAQYGDLAELLLQMSGLPTTPGALAENELIQNTLLNQQAQHAHIVASPKLVQGEISNPEKRERILGQVIPRSFMAPGGNVNNSELSLYLKSVKMSDQELEALIDDVVTREMFLMLLSGLTYIPQYYIDHEEYLGSADRVITIAQKAVGTYSEPIDDAQVDEYYTLQLDRGAYATPEKRAATIWKFDPSAFTIKISPEHIQQYYEANKEGFLKDPARVTVQYVLFKENDLFDQNQLRQYAQKLHDKAATQPERFEQLVQDAVSDGVDVTLQIPEPFSKGELVEEFGSEFDRKTMTLPADNALTPIIETDKGLILAKRLSKTKRIYKNLDLVEQDIKNLLLQERFERRFVDQARSAIESSEEPQVAIEEFISHNNAKKQDFPLHEIGDDHYDQFVFAADPDRYNPYLDGQVGIIVKVDAIEPSQTQPLEQIFDTVKQDLQKIKAKEYAVQEANELLTELKESPENLEQVVAKYGFTTHTITVPMGNDTQSQVKELEEYGISAKDIQDLRYVDEMFASEEPENIDKTVFVVILKELVDTRQEQDRTKEDQLRHYLSTRYEMVQAIQSGLVASLRRNAKIEANSSMSPVS